jgi:hypothetical protein
VIPDDTRTITTASKDVLRKFIPDFLLKQRSIVLRLGPRAGRIYATLRLRDALRVEHPIGASFHRLHGHFFLSALATSCVVPWRNSS